ncbi:transporter substrate-binding domain-containing protein [Kiloniella laminariae]|uniref:Transporter substrate-binding domain-containing protein n=1 Tax=Kiloniella laminariae TaxID=454162 RepID=A0ABT4LHG2_9PROT|nr:transporter substrate-binding domain-containing protein [Kiloniella laminariae]MCZ4280548.1 transporter substrate-binding domain-containing protein [Kiloniella laminariae]
MTKRFEIASWNTQRLSMKLSSPLCNGLICCTIVLLLFFTIQQSRAQEVIKILAVDFPPFEIENGERGLPGFDVETVTAAFGRKGIEVLIEFMPWARAVEMGQKGKVSGILSCADAPVRKQHFWLSEPISYSKRGFVAREDTEIESLGSLAEAKDYKVGSVQGYVFSQELNEAGVDHDLSPNDRSALKKLISGRIELLYSELNVVRYLTKSMSEDVSLKYYPVSTKAYHLCISKRWPDAASVLTRFNEGFMEILSDGSYEEIQGKYR